MGSLQCCSQRERDDQPPIRRHNSTEAVGSLKGMAMKEIDKVFDQLDCDSNGTLSKDEFGRAKAKLKELGYNMEVVGDFDNFDTNNDGNVDREEFQDQIQKQASHRADVLHELTTHNPDFNTSLDTLWKAADENGDGTVDAYELYLFINSMERKLNKDNGIDKPEWKTTGQVKGILSKFDENGDGLIQKREFQKLMEATFMDAILGRAPSAQ